MTFGIRTLTATKGKKTPLFREIAEHPDLLGKVSYKTLARFFEDGQKCCQLAAAGEFPKCGLPWYDVNLSIFKGRCTSSSLWHAGNFGQIYERSKRTSWVDWRNWFDGPLVKFIPLGLAAQEADSINRHNLQRSDHQRCYCPYCNFERKVPPCHGHGFSSYLFGRFVCRWKGWLHQPG